MSTLKKILALTLALAMVLSLNVFATFKDQDQIDEDCVSACTLMDDLGVLKGDKGNMKPEDPITRAEVATMIYRVMNKGKDDSSNYKGMKLFTDVKEGKWYEGYINYCATMELVSGVGNGKFNPEGKVKGTEVLKMLLGCLGYKGEGAKFTGSGWANRVIAQADEIGLIDEYAPALTANAPRQWVAYLFEKAMGCDMVSWNKMTEEFGKKTPVQTLGENKFGLQTLTGVVTDIDYNEGEDDGKVEFSVKTKNGTADFEGFDIDMELFGQQVKVNYKNEEKVYGVTATGKSVVKTVNYVDLKGTYKDGVYKLTADTKELKMTYGDGFEVDTDGKTMKKRNIPGTITLVSSDGKAWDYAYDNKATEYATYTVDAKTGNVTIGTTFSSAIKPADLAKKFTTVGEVANKDFVKISKFEVSSGTPGFGKLPTVEKMEKQTLKLTKVAGTQYTLGGTVYQQKKGVTDLNGAVLGDEYDVYVDCGLIVKATVAAGEKVTALSENLALVTAVADATDTYGAAVKKVKVLLLNGETAEYDYSDADGKETFANVKTNGADKVYEYVLNDDGTISFKTEITDPETTSPVDYKLNQQIANEKVVELKNNYVGEDKAIRFDKNAKFFTKTTKNSKNVYAVMTMADFTGDFHFTADAKQMVVYTDGKTIPTYVAGFMQFAYETVVTDAVYAIAQDAKYTELVDSKTKTFVNVTLKDGTTVTLTLDNADPVAPAEGDVYTYVTTGSTTALTLVDMPDDNNVELYFVQGNEISTDEGIETVADDAVIIVKDKDGKVAFKTLADLVAVDDYTMYVDGKMEKSKLTVLLVSYVADDN